MRRRWLTLHRIAAAVFATSIWAADYRILDPLAVRPDGDAATAVLARPLPRTFRGPAATWS